MLTIQGVGADDNCYERADLINNSARPCKALYGPCVTSAEQYFKRGLLGVHRSPLANITEQVCVGHRVLTPPPPPSAEKASTVEII
jgi:hypothetical protein